jgi:DNA helicase MCM8
MSISGTVIRVSNIRPKLMQMNFICARCSAALTVSYSDGKYAVPDRCVTAQCRSKT